MRRIVFFLFGLLCCAQAFATTFSVNSAQSQATIQSIITAANLADTIQFAAGSYTLSTPFVNLCGKTITGPIIPNFGVNSVPTAVLTGTADVYAFAINSCTSPTTSIHYFYANPLVLVEVGNNNNSGIDIQFNKQQGSQSNPSIYFQGSLGSTVNGTAPNQWINNFDQNIKIWNNILGGAGDCTAIFASTSADGICNGMYFGVATLKNLDVEFNYIIHKQEPIHIVQLAGTFAPGTTNSVCIGCIISNNVALQFHRIGFEIQSAVAAGQGYGGFQINHNYIGEAVSATGGSMLYSLACCQDAGFIQADQNTPRPALFTNDDVGTDLNTCCVNEMPVGFEWWGDANVGAYDLFQGRIQTNAIMWDNGVGPRTLDHITVQTLNGNVGNPSGCASLTSCPPIHNEGDGTVSGTPTLTNITYNIGPNYVTTAFAGVTPTITPASETISSAVMVTISDVDSVNRALSFFYTTDGTTPHSFVSGGSSGTSKLYAGPFSVPPGLTVKAIARWGIGLATQGISFPPNAGYIDSPAASAFYASGGAGLPSITSITLTLPNPSLTAGATGELATVKANYSDGEHLDISTAADVYGDGPATFSSSNATAASIIASGAGAGTVTPLAVGTPEISATLGSLVSTLPLNVVGTPITGGGTGAAAFLGNNTENYSGSTFANYFNSLYSVTPSTGGPWMPGACHFDIIGTVGTGKHWDCLIIAAPTSSTEASTPICHAAYLTTSTTGPGQVNITPTGCGTLANSTAYWVAINTDDTTNPEGLGFSNCGGTCTGSAPTAGGGSGTYGSYFVQQNYGVYTGFPSAFAAQNTIQVTAWVDLTSSTPTIDHCYQDNVGSINTLTKGSSWQMHAWCVYTDGVILASDTTNTRGDAVTAWGISRDATVLSIGNVGSSTPGLVTATQYGIANTTCTVDGTVPCQIWTWSVVPAPVTADSWMGVTLKGGVY